MARNPPYNVGQLNENDNNKNRKYPEVDRHIKWSYAKDSQAVLSTKLYDPYVRFFRWATDRLGGKDGVVCFVSNNSFVEQIAFDGMRKHLLQDFTRVYHLHLEGNVRENPALSGTAYNVFGIQVGVGITIAIRSAKHTDHRLYFYRLDKHLRRAEKLQWLEECGSYAKVHWEELKPDDRNTWLCPENADAFETFLPIGVKGGKQATGGNTETIFRTFSLGTSTNRDAVAYDFQSDELAKRVEAFCDDYNAEADRYSRKSPAPNLDTFLKTDRVKWSESLKRLLKSGRKLTFDKDNIRFALYRPFTKMFLYYADGINDRPGRFGGYLRDEQDERDNRTIVVSDPGWRSDTLNALCCQFIPDLHLCSSLDGHQCFPFYFYNEDSTERMENVTNWALNSSRHKSERCWMLAL